MWLRCAVTLVLVLVLPAALAQPSPPKVFSNVTYAQGLVCTGPNTSCTPINLYLDVYVPTNASQAAPLPAYILMHGGGNSGGSRHSPPEEGSAAFFAARGFVAFNIDYRLAHDFGPTPPFPSAARTSALEWEPKWASGYPAVRDLKAAIRFVRASANKRFGVAIDTSKIVVSGGSAGATNAITAGVVFEEDYKSELTLAQDPTLASTHLNESSAVAAVVSHWASDGEINLITAYDPKHRPRYSSANAPIIEFHGDVDTTIPIAHAYAVQRAYNATGVDYELHVLSGCAHAAWCYGCSGPCSCQEYCPAMDEIAYTFLRKHLKL